MLNIKDKSLDSKYQKLREIFLELESVVIGFSGGVDSTLLMKVGADVLQDKAIGVIATSSTYPEREKNEALELARAMNANIRIIKTEEDKNPKFKENPVDRCFYCKNELFSKMTIVAEKEGIKFIADGTNVDDISDYRPGTKAQEKYSVRSPLKESGMTKADIREISRLLGLPTHDKQSFACLSSRFPYGSSITSDKLQKVDAAENFLLSLGFNTVRVRHYDETVRLEFSVEDFPKILENGTRENIISELKKIGYTYITLDLEGFRSGSMNEVLNL